MAFYNDTFVLPFEDSSYLTNQSPHDFFQEHWKDCFVYTGMYLIVVFGGKTYMQDRSRYDLRTFLAIWSGVLAIFSIFGAIRTLPELVHAIHYNSFEYSVCNPSYLEHPVTKFWSFVFALSKVYELGDTVFIVLRKQQLIFLHWYHHITVLLYVWTTYTERIGGGRWFMVMNYMVHSIMYTYYCCRALKFNIPKQVNMFITALQLIQMIIGASVSVYTWRLLDQGKPCGQTYDNLRLCFIMYFSYFVLFAHFFYTTYIVRKPMQAHHHKKSH